MTSEPDEYEALEPCPNPWCNSTTAPVPVALKREGWRVACACGVSTHRASSEAEAIAAWNRRDHVEAKLAEARADLARLKAEKHELTMKALWLQCDRAGGEDD
jgi:hypothetical protein